MYNTVCTFAWQEYDGSSYCLDHALTWREFKMVKSQANTVAFGLAATITVGIPNTQVSPSRGRSITVALKVVLLARSDKINGWTYNIIKDATDIVCEICKTFNLESLSWASIVWSLSHKLLVNHHLLHYTLAAHAVLMLYLQQEVSICRVGNVTVLLSMHFVQHWFTAKAR